MLSFFIILPLIIIIGLLSDFYIYRKFIKQKYLRVLFLGKTILFQLSVLTVILGFVFRFDVLPMSVIMWVFVCYMMLYIPQSLFMMLTLCDFKRRFVRYNFAIAALVFSSIFYGTTFGRVVPRVELREVSIERLPDAFTGYKIVQISDVHLGSLSNGAYIIHKLVSEINVLEPDAIVLTGDLVNLKTDEIYPYTDILSRLKAKDGVYSVLGNHDYGDYVKWGSDGEKIANLEELKRVQGELGWRLLNNESEIIRRGDDSIAIVGVENWGLPPFPAYGDLKRAMEGISSATFKVLLSHNPTHWDAEVLQNKDIDLMLAGHTHAMQMKFSLFGMTYSPASHMYDRWSGLYREGDQYLYVNDGVGCVGVPMRMGTRPEITLIVLK